MHGYNLHVRVGEVNGAVIGDWGIGKSVGRITGFRIVVFSS